ncbi:MAG: exodeoxyribonuclease V subunit alpha [Acidimicrobiales bacterium]
MTPPGEWPASTGSDPVAADPFGSGLVLGAVGPLRAFNRAGVLAPVDVHVATRLARLGRDSDERVVLAVALAVRGPRYGHVRVDLLNARANIAEGVEDDTDLDSLPWPDPGGWLEALARSPLVAVGEDGPVERPLRLIGTSLYLDRYWRDERAVAADLIQRAQGDPPPVDAIAVRAGLDRLFPDDPSGEQRWAAGAAMLRLLSVIAGGPGTGKTTTVARLLALLHEQAVATGTPAPLVALAAPTGKAAMRMEEALHQEAHQIDVSGPIRELLLSTGASTLHRLLGARRDHQSRFRHDRLRRLPFDVLVVDETSMVPLALMARLLEAARPDARIVLVGDPEQLASVEAGAVLGDIAGPALDEARMTQRAASELAELTGVARPSAVPTRGVRIGDGIVVLRSNHRFRGALADLAGAVRGGDADSAVDVLSSADPTLQWLRVEVADLGPSAAASSAIAPLREEAVGAGRALFEAARTGDQAGAIRALQRFRVLCAHRRGPAGAATWNGWVEDWIAASVDSFSLDSPWYVGRPVMVTANDYGLGLYNGDSGAVVALDAGRLAAVFPSRGSLRAVSPSRLADVQTVYAMTVHKSQGSEFDHVAAVLPPASSPVLTRELLYTAVTRARHALTLAASEESVRAAVARPVDRASGLTQLLWGSVP